MWWREAENSIEAHYVDDADATTRIEIVAHARFQLGRTHALGARSNPPPIEVIER